jgi:hypothetical protein
MADILTRHLIFFAVGIIQDLLITYYYQSISKERAWKASALSTVITLVNLVILYKIITGIEDQIISVIIAYALGNGVGTMIAMKKDLIKSLKAKKHNII